MEDNTMSQQQKAHHIWPISSDSSIVLFYGVAYFTAYHWFAPATTWRAQNWAYWILLIVNVFLLVLNIIKWRREQAALSTWQKIDIFLPLGVLLLMKVVDLIVFQRLF
ncbi:hypothetical protein FD09_GL000426 [Schleiferilactobacillus perolens DSM 12744]|uniref:Uncharacterized protein n=2 Tax=Schleiferilactobacillus perolens TaxID=100468 RepID=A0A0R1N3K1_9LACO|nr:hypothetical protein FD09_GL000426 [Schleiferilactobacillus perolens DSM 12744]